MGAKFCAEVSEMKNDEDLETFFVDSGAHLHITNTKNISNNFKECKIYVTVVNGQKNKCKTNVTVNMNLQGGETVNLNDKLYLPKAVNDLLSVTRLVSKGATMGLLKKRVP